MTLLNDLNKWLQLTLLFFSSIGIAHGGYINLTGKKIDVQLDHYYVEEVKVVRADKNFAGVIDEFRFLYYERGIEEEISLLLKSNFPKQGNKKPLTIVVYELIPLLTNLYSYTDISIGFYEIKEDKVVELLRTGALNHRTWRNKLFMGNNYGEECISSITDAFKTCFSDFVFRAETNSLNHTQIDNESINQKPRINKSNFPILKNNPKKGIIRTFSSFIDNNIDTTIGFFPIEKNENNYSNVYRINNDVDVWGICDGTSYYKRIGSRYYPLQITEDSIFIFTEPQPIVPVEERSIGGFIDYVENIKHGKTKKVIKEILNLYTDRVMTITEDTLIIECFYWKSPSQTCIIIQADTICLNSIDYLVYQTSLYDVFVPISYISGTKTATYYFNQQNYRRLTVLRNGNKISATFDKYYPRSKYFNKKNKIEKLLY